MPEKEKKKFPVFIIYVVIGLILGAAIGGYFHSKQKEINLEQQAVETQRSKEKSEKQVARKEEVVQKDQKDQKEEKQIEEIKSDKPKEVEEKTKDWQTYTNTQYKYTLKYPQGWYSAPTNTENSWVVYFSTYNPKDVAENVIPPPGVKVEVLVQGNPRNLSLKEWVEEGHLFAGQPKYTKEIKVDGLPAIREEIDYQGLMTNVYFFRGEDVVTISYSGKMPDYNDNMNLFDLIIKSFAIEK